ncbi:MAG: hypothetical protein WD555_06515 [Fulvivirga sp.]
MKTLLYTLFACYIFIACSTPKTETETSAASPDTVTIAKEQVPEESEAVGIWDKVSVRAKPSEDGKWLTLRYENNQTADSTAVENEI